MAHITDYAVTYEGNLTVYTALNELGQPIESIKLYADIPDIEMLWDHCELMGHTIDVEMA